MKLATWNVNSIRARLDRLIAWLAEARPDVVCLQETKVEDARFPYDALTAAGYHAVHAGLKTCNGVAILSRVPATDVARGLGDGELDLGDIEQQRLIAATIDGVRILSVYVPNGGEPGSPQIAFKMRWLSRLLSHLQKHHRPTDPLVLCGDFNVAPEARDVDRPDEWKDSVLFNEEARAALSRLMGFGLIDVYRRHVPDAGKYSWWDYRQLSFPKNNGLRIDHFLATQPVADRSRSALIDREMRKGKDASDHAPVVIEL